MRWSKTASRMASIGTRLCPPAISFAPSPSSASRSTASLVLSGAWYSNGAGFTGCHRPPATCLRPPAQVDQPTMAAGVSGSLVIVTPNGASASATALTTAGGAPIAPPSPTPL